MLLSCARGDVLTYWAYEHWAAGINKAVIHRGSCGFCNEGRGTNKPKEQGVRGQWLGPCDTYEKAYNRAVTTGRPVKHCSFCNPHSSIARMKKEV